MYQLGFLFRFIRKDWFRLEKKKTQRDSKGKERERRRGKKEEEEEREGEEGRELLLMQL